MINQSFRQNYTMITMCGKVGFEAWEEPIKSIKVGTASTTAGRTGTSATRGLGIGSSMKLQLRFFEKLMSKHLDCSIPTDTPQR